MPLPENYLDYPHRRPGLDHARYEHARLAGRPGPIWPGGRRVALWVTVAFEFFPMDMGAGPVTPIGAMEGPYPDYRTFTSRDYGNRIGAYRIMKVLARHGVRATAIFNSEVARRYPLLLRHVLEAGWEIAGGGVDMGRVIHGHTPLAAERAIIAESLSVLRQASGQAVTGWHSPAKSESFSTLDLLAEHDIRYVMDWTNDEMPFPLRTAHGELLALPMTDEWADNNILYRQHMRTDELQRQVMDAFTFLDEEARSRGPRLLSLPLHPWVTGQPHRIAALDRLLGRILANASVWPATGAEIAALCEGVG